MQNSWLRSCLEIIVNYSVPLNVAVYFYSGFVFRGMLVCYIQCFLALVCAWLFVVLPIVHSLLI